MPVPQICFNKNMTSDERLKILNKMRDWSQFPENAEMKAKISVLEKIIDFAKQNLVNAGRLTFMHADKEDDSIYQTCESVFRHTDLPELLFLQHVINQLKLIKPESHSLRSTILPLAQKNKDILVIPVINTVRNTGIAMGCFSIFCKFGLGFVAGCLTVYFSEQITEWRVSRELENKIALKAAGGSVPRIEDGLDDVVSGVATLANKGYNMAYSIFKQSTPQVEEKKVATAPPALNK